MGIQVGSAYGKVSVDASGVVTGVTTAVGSLNKLKNAGTAVADVMTSAGQTMTAMFTVPLALVGKQSFDTAMEFDSAMNILKGATKATKDEMQLLSDQAKALGADMTLPGTSAADAAEAMAELAKAGFDVNETLAASRGVLQLSAAGQIDNAEAAKIAANALNAFNLDASEAVRVADLLAAAANSTSADMKEMGDSLQMSASLASMAGVEIEDLVTAIGLMANKGIQGSDAGTSLKSMLLHLQAPSQKAAGLMKELGIDIYDASGKMKDMREIIQIFSGSMSGLTQEQRDYALATIFGSDAVRAANIILMGGTEAFDSMKTSVTEAGSATKMAGTMMEGLPGAIENIKSSFETAQIAALEPFKEDIISISKGIAGLFNAFTSLPAPIRKLIVFMLMLLALTGPLLMLGGGMINFAFKIMTVVQALQGLGIVLPSLSAIISGIPAALTSVSTVITGTVLPAFSTFFTFITGTAIPAITAFAVANAWWIVPLLLVAATVYLVYLAFKNNWMGITDTVKQAWFLIGYSVSKIIERFRGIGTTVSQLWALIKRAFVDGIGKAIDWLVSKIDKLKAALANIKLPDALTPGSPTPFENGLRGIASAMEELSKKNLPSFQAGLSGAAGAGSLSQMLAKPALNQSTSSQTNSTMNFASGLTLRDAERMFSRNNEMMFRKLSAALG